MQEAKFVTEEKDKVIILVGGKRKMIELRDLLEEDEVLVTYHITTDGWYSWNAIIRQGSDDISAALEDTLHRILEAGGTENDVMRIMGAKIPTENELKELKNTMNIYLLI